MRLYIVCNVIPVELIIEKSVMQTGRESFIFDRICNTAVFGGCNSSPIARQM